MISPKKKLQRQQNWYFKKFRSRSKQNFEESCIALTIKPKVNKENHLKDLDDIKEIDS